jgi:DNA-binding YbaB/EbfC family protein
MKGFGALGDFGNIVKQAQKQAQEIQKKIEKTREELKEMVVEGAAGGGMVKCLVDGDQEILKIEIDPKVVDPDDVEFLQEMVLAAVRQGMKKAKEMSDERMKEATGGLPLGGLGGLF